MRTNRGISARSSALSLSGGREKLSPARLERHVSLELRALEVRLEERVDVEEEPRPVRDPGPTALLLGANLGIGKFAILLQNSCKIL